ncbi:MAG TPA: hypothetical protein VD790_04340 [Thermoleophilaceae bacterium]|nr:hypothetical protein [Thermoleophilaceae bacterium]
MRTARWTALLAIVGAAMPTGAAADAPGRAPDCRFQGAHDYQDLGRIQVFTLGGRRHGCLTDVGRAHRLRTGALGARSAAARRVIFGRGDWVAFSARTRSGQRHARATNLRTGRTHGTAARGSVTALVVNGNGTLAWIAGTSLRTKPARGPARLLGSDPALDRRFLGLENDAGCAVTWRVAGEQRSSSIFCRWP